MLAVKSKNAPKGWKLKSSRQVYDSYYLKVFEDRLDLAGTDKLYIRGVRRDYCTIVPFATAGANNNNNSSSPGILTIRSYRHIVDSYQLEVPSGYIDPGETPRQAAARELEEETGYVAKKLVHVARTRWTTRCSSRWATSLRRTALKRPAGSNWGTWKRYPGRVFCLRKR